MNFQFICYFYFVPQLTESAPLRQTIMMIFYLATVLPFAFAYEDPSSRCAPPSPDPTCNANQILCPGVTSLYNGCKSPGFCMDKLHPWLKDNDGNPCPASCPVGVCDVRAKEKLCLSPPVNGCYSLGYCVPFNNDTNCHGTCSTPTCNEEAGEILCPGGINPSDGCPIDDQCAKPYGYYKRYWPYTYVHGGCPAMCPPPPCNIDAGEQLCDNGKDENGCWLGGYCATNCASG